LKLYQLATKAARFEVDFANRSMRETCRIQKSLLLHRNTSSN